LLAASLNRQYAVPENLSRRIYYTSMLS